MSEEARAASTNPRSTDPRWLQWVKRLQAIAHNGLVYARDPYDVERYEAVREIAAEIAASYSDADLATVRGLFAGDVGHITPKVDVRGAVFRDDKILLVRERHDGLWTLPGGWADPGESPSVAVAREVFEESGYRVHAVRLAALYDRDRHGHTPLPFSCYKIFFICALLDDAPVTHDANGHAALFETDETGFFAEHELPDLSLPRVTPAQLTRLFAHYRHPDWPADFD